MRYWDIVSGIRRIADGTPMRYYYDFLKEAAKDLKNRYSIEPVDIVAAMCLLKHGKRDYARILLQRAYRDLVAIGKRKRWL